MYICISGQELNEMKERKLWYYSLKDLKDSKTELQKSLKSLESKCKNVNVW